VTPSLYETLSVSLDEDGVATLTLDRPGQLNAFDPDHGPWTSTSDGKEGAAAFLEKRPATFTGKASELPRID